MHRLIPLLIIAAVLFGAPYASAIILRAMGPWSATGVEQDGSLTHMQFGAHLPRPDWVPFYPGAWIVQASKVTTAKVPSGFHSLEIGTRASLEEVKRFYTEQLAQSGFEVVDLGTMSLNAPTAALLGIAGTLSAKRAATDDRIDIQIRTAEGLVPSRLLQIHWTKISEYPDRPQPGSPPPAPESKS
jgi:hypothetical protein